MKVVMDQHGVPIEVSASDCSAPFAEAAEHALRGWLWDPPRDGDCIEEWAQTTIAVKFRLAGQ